jgi:hypothetical protein
MRSVVFLIGITESYGEREQALRFAERLEQALEPVFIVKPKVAAHVSRYHTETFVNVSGAMRAIDQLDPALILASEYYNFSTALREAVVASGRRLGTFDATTMGVELNSNPLSEPTPLRSIHVPRGMFRLQACPVADPLPDAEDLYHWQMFDRVERNDGSAARRAFDIPSSSRLAVFAVAPWAIGAATKLGHLGHYERLTSRLLDAFVAAGEPTTLVVVGAEERAPIRRDCAEIRFTRYLQRESYDELLLGADLWITDNAIQVSLAKAFVAGIPTMLVVNSRPELPPTYQIFPLRFSLPPESEYMRAIRPVELSDADQMAARVASAWRPEPDPARDAYLASLTRLRSPIEILRATGTI